MGTTAATLYLTKHYQRSGQILLHINGFDQKNI